MPKKMTNLGKIRGMSEYELGELIYRLVGCEGRIYCDDCPLCNECDIYTMPKGWLKKEAGKITDCHEWRYH